MIKNPVKKNVQVLHTFGELLRDFLSEAGKTELADIRFSTKKNASLANALVMAEIENPWFIPEFQLRNLRFWADLLHSSRLAEWLENYPSQKFFLVSPLRIALILAGNIPLVGLHDIITVLVSGHIAVTKMSSKDKMVYPVLRNLLETIDPEFARRWILTDGEPMKNLDAVIATGSDNSSRYFNYYFGRYPHIIRKNRNSIAILTGYESDAQMMNLADDIFLYFGLGCRNVSKIYVPEDFNPDLLYRNIMDYSYFSYHNKYVNNYDYHKAVFLINQIKFFDNGFLILRENQSFSSPVGCLYYEKYQSNETLHELLEQQKHQIQCLVSVDTALPMRVEPGKTQFPELNDYADGMDTLNFLLNLSEN